MKRSEMINFLQKSFNNHMNSEDSIDDNEVYSRILNDIEEKGMMPPFSEEIYSRVWRDGGDGHKWDKE